MLIVCEGRETEWNYLDKLRRSDAVTKHFAVTVIPGKGGSRLQIVRRAIKQHRNRGEFDRTCCVMDVERLATPEAVADFNAACRLGSENGVQLYLSNPAFEIWLLAHFVRTSRRFIDCESVIVALDKHWSASFRRPYEKNDQRIYSRLADRTDLAIENAKAVYEQDHRAESAPSERNSSTQVYQLVGFLLDRTVGIQS